MHRTCEFDFSFLSSFVFFACFVVNCFIPLSPPNRDKKSSISQNALLCTIFMSYIPHSHRVGLRRAIVASVVIHFVLVATVVVCATMTDSQSQTSQPGFDTRIADVKLQLDAEESTNLAVPELKQSEKTPSPAQRESTPVSQPPTVSSVPNLLPPGFLAMVQRSQNANEKKADAGSTTDNVKPAGTAAASEAMPLHGAMKPGQSVVYILDCSGSMGEFGKLDMARSALIATLRRQPDTLRFQVIPYNSNARLLVPGGMSTIAVNVGLAEAKLVKLEAVGRSNHAEAIRIAVELRPEAIVWLTDADDLSAAKLKPIIGRAGKPIPIYLAEVTARGVGTPREFR
jgi:Mg-chelatase subunit ChlD